MESRQPPQISPRPGAPGVVDPTANVLALVEAAVRRIDDVMNIQVTRINDRLESERTRVNELLALRAEHFKELAIAEAKRIDAIRLVDVNAVAVANERAGDAANVLANQVAVSAETLRGLVATTAATQAQQLAQTTTQITERLSALEKSSYQGQGKQQLADPQLIAMFDELKHLRESESSRKGGLAMWSSIISGVLAFVAIAGFALHLITTTTNN